jgi:hypothetical protein
VKRREVKRREDAAPPQEGKPRRSRRELNPLEKKKMSTILKLYGFIQVAVIYWDLNSRWSLRLLAISYRTP